MSLNFSGTSLAAATASDHLLVPSTATTATTTASLRLSRDARLARQFTSEADGRVSFARDAAIAAGMSTDFARIYSDRLRVMQSFVGEGGGTVIVSIVGNDLRVDHTAESLPVDAKVVVPQGSRNVDVGNAPAVSASCIMAQVGVGLGTAALMASLFASGGAALLAIAGYTHSAISLVMSCQK